MCVDGCLCVLGVFACVLGVFVGGVFVCGGFGGGWVFVCIYIGGVCGGSCVWGICVGVCGG